DASDQDHAEQQFQPIALQGRTQSGLDLLVDLGPLGIGAAHDGGQQSDVGGDEGLAVNLMADAELDEFRQRLGCRLLRLGDLVKSLNRCKAGGAASGLGRGAWFRRRLLPLADNDGQWCPSSRRSAIIERQARAVSPPLSISVRLARTQACSSSSTVSTP